MTIFGMYIFSWLFRVVITTYGLGFAGLVVFFIAPLWVPVQTRTILGIVSIALISGGSAYWFAFHQGEDFAIQKMAAREQIIVGKVSAKQLEVEACNGGVDWDVVTGTCIAN